MTSRSVRDAYRKKTNEFNLIGCIGILAVCSRVGGRIHIQGPSHVEKTPFASAVAGAREAKQTETPACAGTEVSIQVTAVGTALSASEAWQRNEELQETRRKVKMDPYYPRFHLAPLAVTPKDHGISADARIFSGCVVDNEGTGTALYTIKHIDIGLATSPHDLATFERYPANPIIKGPPPGLDISNMRDPWAWKEADRWYLIVGSGLRDGRGPVLPLYSVKNTCSRYRTRPRISSAATRTTALRRNNAIDWTTGGFTYPSLSLMVKAAGSCGAGSLAGVKIHHGHERM